MILWYKEQITNLLHIVFISDWDLVLELNVSYKRTATGGVL